MNDNLAAVHAYALAARLQELLNPRRFPGPVTAGLRKPVLHVCSGSMPVPGGPEYRPRNK